MRSIIFYFSHSGNTQKVAQVVEDYLKAIGEVELFEVKGLDESRSFFGQAIRAFRRKRGVTQEINKDLKEYDVICFGTPVWAFGPAPAMNTVLDKSVGIEGKKVVLFTTYGSGTGNEKCLDYMQNILSGKGVQDFKRFSVQQSKVNDKSFVLSRIKEAIS